MKYRIKEVKAFEQQPKYYVQYKYDLWPFWLTYSVPTCAEGSEEAVVFLTEESARDLILTEKGEINVRYIEV